MSNRRLTEKFGVKNFPTVLVLDAKGDEVATVSGYDGESGPEGYLKMLESEIRDAPDVKKYIKPIEDILNASDAEMKKEMQVLQETYLSKLTNTTENLSAAEKRKAFKEISKAMQKALFDTVLPKYIPLYDKAFADAHAMSVPAHMEAKKNELINRQESNYKMMKMAYEAYQEKKSNPDTADDDDDGDEAEEDDEDESRGCARQMPRLIVPPPELAKTDEEYFRCVAEPFYNKNIVDVYDAASETNMVVREKTLVVRKALARNCALVTPEFPLASDKAAADWLWKLFCASRPLRRTLRLAPAYRIFAAALLPLTWTIERVVRRFARKPAPREKTTPDDLLRILQDRKAGVRLTDFESALIARILVLRSWAIA